MTDLTNLTVAQIRDGHRAGDFSAVEVAQAFSANVAAAKALNAFIVETPGHSLDAAKQADADRAAVTLKPLSGVPIGMKDLFATKGVQTTAASHMLEGFIPPYESTVSQKLCDAGAGMLGKLNLDQFRSEEHTSELQSLMRISYAVFCLKKKTKIKRQHHSESTNQQ